MAGHGRREGETRGTCPPPEMPNAEKNCVALSKSCSVYSLASSQRETAVAESSTNSDDNRKGERAPVKHLAFPLLLPQQNFPGDPWPPLPQR